MEWNAEPSERALLASTNGSQKPEGEHTLRLVLYLSKRCWVFQLNLVSDDAAIVRSRPIDGEAVIPRDPFSTDVGVHLY